jgi:hypothetical protein
VGLIFTADAIKTGITLPFEKNNLKGKRQISCRSSLYLDFAYTFANSFPGNDRYLQPPSSMYVRIRDNVYRPPGK